MIMMYYWRFWEPCANAMLVVLLPKLWFWIENHDWHKCFLDVFLGLTLTGPKKASKSTILHNRLNKEKKLLVDVANLATCCHDDDDDDDDDDVLLDVLGTLRKCYVSSRLGLTTFPPTRARVSGKRLVAFGSQSSGSGSWEGDTRGAGKGHWGHNGTHLVRCYVSSPVAKTLVLDWKSWLAQLFLDVFVTLCGVNPLLDPKKLQNQQFYIIDWIRKKTPGRCCQSRYLLLWSTIGGKADERAHKQTLTKQFPIEPTWCFTRAKLAPKCPCHTMCSQRQVSWISAPKPKH